MRVGVELERYAELAPAIFGQPDREFSAIAVFVVGRVDAADQRVTDRRQGRLDLDAALRVDRGEDETMLLQE